MREAIITCTCPSIRIPDLNLTLSKGNVIHLNAATAEASKDLAIAKNAFGVKVEFIGRCRAQRPGSGNVPPPAPPPPPPPEPPPPVKAEGIDLDVLAEKVAKRMGQDVGAIRDLLKGDLRELLVETMAGLALSGGTQAGNSGRVAPEPVDEPMPMFIPDNLVGDASADIEVQQDDDEPSSVDNAAAQLRRMRKKRKP